MKIGMSLNKFGTPISVHVCEGCRERFTVCPAVVDGIEWGGCQAEICVTYDRARDADRLFADDPDSIESVPAAPMARH